MSLDLSTRAALLGLGERAFVALAQRDRRNAASPMLASPHLKRWIEFGSPDVDLSRLEFCGSDEVRRVLVDVLGRLPMSAAWHAVESIAFVEVGRAALGWQAHAPVVRPHMIALSGCISDEELAHVIAHEVGHSFTKPILPPATVVRMSRDEATNALVSTGLVTHDVLGRERAAREQEADDLAELWGFRRQYTADGTARAARGD